MCCFSLIYLTIRDLLLDYPLHGEHYKGGGHSAKRGFENADPHY